MVLKTIVAGFSLLTVIFVVIMFFRSFSKIKKVKVLLDVALGFLLVSFIFMMHSLVELLGIENGYYSTTGLMTIAALAYVIIVLRYKSPISCPIIFNYGGKKCR